MMSLLPMEEEVGPLDDEVPEGRGGTVSVSALNSGDAFTRSRRTRRGRGSRSKHWFHLKSLTCSLMGILSYLPSKKKCFL